MAVRPFLLLLKRTDCDRPYLALWVDNSEILVGVKPGPDRVKKNP